MTNGKEPFRLTPVNQGPFYGAKNTGDILCTMDGIVIDTNMNAINTEGNAIPGLYVIGNDSGAYFANTYPNLLHGHGLRPHRHVRTSRGQVPREALMR